jgi:glutathione S-transferase
MPSNHPEQLYYSTTSPYARKVRIAAAEKQIPFLHKLDVPWNQDTKTIALNPLGKVPVWVMTDGTALFDSRVIVEYLDGASAVNPLVPLEFRARIAVKRLEALADGVMDAALAVFAERRKRPAELQYPDWVARQFSKIHRSLQVLSNELGERDYFHGKVLSLADIAVVSALGYVGLRYADDFSWQDKYPVLERFYRRMMLRPSVSDSIPVL